MAILPRQPAQQPPSSSQYISSHPDAASTMAPTAVYVGEGKMRHMDVEETLRVMAANLDELRVEQLAPDGHPPLADKGAIGRYEKKIDRARKWGGWVWGLVSILSLVFTAGITWAVFMGANATDEEVAAADKAAIILHNGGIDPSLIDKDTHSPVGHHPDMRSAIKSNAEAIKTIREDVLPPMIETQKKLDKRSEYQYELTKWESKKAEARRKRKSAPPKGSRLEELEGELLRGDYN